MLRIHNLTLVWQRANVLHMKRIATLTLAVIATFTLSACGDEQNTPVTPAQTTVAATEPTEPTPTMDETIYDASKDVTEISCTRHSQSDGDAINIKFTLKNNGTDTAEYDVNFNVLDSSGNTVAAFGVALGTMVGPTQPGQVVKYNDNHGMRTGSVPSGDFTCQLAYVDRFPTE